MEAHTYAAYIREYTPRGCVPSDNVIFQCFRYGVVIVTSDIRSSHHSDEEKSDLASQQTVRVKRTLPKDAAEQHGPTIKNAVQQNKGEPAIDIKIYHPLSPLLVWSSSRPQCRSFLLAPMLCFA